MGLAASTTARDDFSVFEMNDVYLETTNASFAQRGLLTYGCIFIFAMGLMLVVLTLWAITNPPANVVGAEHMVCIDMYGRLFGSRLLHYLHRTLGHASGELHVDALPRPV